MKKLFKPLMLIFIGLLILPLTGCNTNNPSADDDRLLVYTSFYPMYDFAAKVGGDKVNLINLVPSGTEPHDWEPSPSDVAKLEKADVFIYNGLGMESWVDKVLNSTANRDRVVVEASKGLTYLRHEDEHEDDPAHADSEYDPHIWLNPLNAKKQMEAIKNAFVQADPANKDYYEKNFTDYAGQFDALDQEYKAAAATFTKQEIIVSHESFGYLCEAYGLKQIGIEGLSADSEPTPARMAEIADFAKAHHVTYIFFEELNSKIARAIANEAGAQTAVLSPLEGITEKDLAAGKEYFSVMRDNLTALKKALQ